MSIKGQNIAQQVTGTIEKLIGNGTAEKLVFRKFQGSTLAKAISTGSKLKDSAIETVILRVNPHEVSFDKKKIINKVQTSAPGRFVIYDWGTDLTVLTINGSTGNLLPESIISGNDPLSTFQTDLASRLDGVVPGNEGMRAEAQGVLSQGTGIASTFVTNMMMRSMSYMELLEMSPKYQVFRKLEDMFEKTDADRDVLILEFGDYSIFRGYFENFKFTMTAESPWIWKYDLTFIILADLNKAQQRHDDDFPDNDFTR